MSRLARVYEAIMKPPKTEFTQMEDAIYELVPLIKKQIEQQEEANGIMRGLVEAMQGVAQETLELRQFLKKQSRGT
jgi:hypothetical protein